MIHQKLLTILTIVTLASAPCWADGFKNPQLRCNTDDKSAAILIGNDKSADLLDTQYATFEMRGEVYDVASSGNAAITITPLDSSHRYIRVTDSSDPLVRKLELEVSAYVHPFDWTVGTLNGQKVKCSIDPVFFGLIWKK